MESLAANKVKGIRACVCSEPFTAKMSRAHNDCNILAFGARVVGGELAKMIVDTWINTEFEGGSSSAQGRSADGDRGEKLKDFKKETSALHFIRARKSFKKGRKMQEYDLSQWVLFFFLYSFLGWIRESCYVSVRKHRWVNRGFMHGPMLPLYGSGAMVVLIVTIPVRDNILLVFLMGMIGATILEYFTGITMERLFHVRYWDYRNLKFNVRGYICPLASLCWGVFSILMVKVVHIPFEHMVLLIPVTIADILAFVLTIAAAVDFTQSFNEAMDMKRILVQLEASKEQIRKMQERLKDASEEMQDRLKDASEGVQERLKRASEGVQERLEDSYLLYEERKEMKAAEKQTRKRIVSCEDRRTA